MGYSAFQVRRIFSPPKQIRWEPNLPVGNLAFQVYGNRSGGESELLDFALISNAGGNINWLMTLQVSEV
jgi:hypothetical protein